MANKIGTSGAAILADHSLITAVITGQGIFREPYTKTLLTAALSF